MSKPFGIDVSRWQGEINWDAVGIYEKKVQFTGIRAAINTAYVDSWFDRNWVEAKRVGIARAAYHVFWPTTDPIKQADHFLKVVGDDLGELPLVADVELKHNSTPAVFQRNLLKYLQRLEEVTERKPIIYSRASVVDPWITGLGKTPPSWLNEYDWWLAQYLLSGEEHPGPVTMPKGVDRDRCIIHQTSDRGKPFGVQSKALDYNRWQFNLMHLLSYMIKKAPVLVVHSEEHNQLLFAVNEIRQWRDEMNELLDVIVPSNIG